MAFTARGIAILGGGQLGKMLCQAASRWSIATHVLDRSVDFPAGDVCSSFTEGDFRDAGDVLEFGRKHHIVTIEIESVNSEALHTLSDEGVRVFPQPVALDSIKDRLLQKEFYRDAGLPAVTARTYDSLQDVRSATDTGAQTFPFVMKARRDGYDGRGVAVIQSTSDLDNAFDAPCIIEPLVDIDLEISVIVARDANGNIRAFPPVSMIFHPDANLVEYLQCPAGIGPALEQEAIQIAQSTIEAFGITGLLAVEMFLTSRGELLINEVAPRPHNSGHHTIEACTVSQYEQHLRAILGFPLGDPQLQSPCVMVNLLGAPGYEGPVRYEGISDALKVRDAHLHLYGKAQTQPWRKMGHVTVLAGTPAEAMKKAKYLADTIKVIA